VSPAAQLRISGRSARGRQDYEGPIAQARPFAPHRPDGRLSVQGSGRTRRPGDLVIGPKRPWRRSGQRPARLLSASPPTRLPGRSGIHIYDTGIICQADEATLHKGFLCIQPLPRWNANLQA
jgi:hypothetical protein